MARHFQLPMQLLHLLLMFGLIATPNALGEQRDAAAKPKIELRWVETKQIPNVTEAEGFQSSCDPDSIVYPHNKPALVLTSKEVKEVQLRNNDLSKNGLSSQNYTISFILTDEARRALAATCEGTKMRLLTVIVDGHPWGIHRYEIDPDAPFVPARAQAASFVPEIGFLSSKAEAQRIVDAFK